MSKFSILLLRVAALLTTVSTATAYPVSIGNPHHDFYSAGQSGVECPPQPSRGGGGYWSFLGSTSGPLLWDAIGTGSGGAYERSTADHTNGSVANSELPVVWPRSAQEDQIRVQPYGSDAAVVRWTSSFSQTVSFIGVISDPDSRGDGVGFRIVKNGSVVLVDTQIAATGSYSINTQVAVVAGDYFDFETNRGSGGGSGYDACDLTLHVVKEYSPDAALSTIIPFASPWTWLHPINGTDPESSSPGFQTNWKLPTFPNFASTGTAPLGYGTFDLAVLARNIGTPASGSRYTAYFRKQFTLSQPLQGSFLANLLCDDGVIIYVDGERVAELNHSGADSYTSLADSTMGENRMHSVPLRLNRLEAGAHTIAVSVHNAATTSSDLAFDLNLLFNGSANPSPVPVTAYIITESTQGFSRTTSVWPYQEPIQYTVKNTGDRIWITRRRSINFWFGGNGPAYWHIYYRDTTGLHQLVGVQHVSGTPGPTTLGGDDDGTGTLFSEALSYDPKTGFAEYYYNGARRSFMYANPTPPGVGEFAVLTGATYGSYHYYQDNVMVYGENSTTESTIQLIGSHLPKSNYTNGESLQLNATLTHSRGGAESADIALQLLNADGLPIKTEVVTSGFSDGVTANLRNFGIQIPRELASGNYYLRLNVSLLENTDNRYYRSIPISTHLKVVAHGKLYGLCVGGYDANIRGDVGAANVLVGLKQSPNWAKVHNTDHPLIFNSQTAVARLQTLNAIDYLKEVIAPGDTFVFYYNGHGGATGQVGTDEGELPVLYRTKSGNEGVEYSNDRRDEVICGTLDDDSLTEALAGPEWKLVNKIIILDCCHAGGFWGGSSTDGGDLNKLENIMLLAATTESDLTTAGRNTMGYWTSEVVIPAISEILPTGGSMEALRANIHSYHSRWKLNPRWDTQSWYLEDPNTLADIPLVPDLSSPSSPHFTSSGAFVSGLNDTIQIYSSAGSMIVEWPSAIEGILEWSDNLSAPASWRELVFDFTDVGIKRKLIAPSHLPRAFFRWRR